MKLLGKDISPESLLGYVEGRLKARGLDERAQSPIRFEGLEPPVDPTAFALEALAEHADATVGLPLETHREGFSGAAVLLAKRAFRAAGQVFINEALARQKRFNGHVRDGYAQLAAEVVRLRLEVEALREAKAAVSEQGASTSRESNTTAPAKAKGASMPPEASAAASAKAKRTSTRPKASAAASAQAKGAPTPREASSVAAEKVKGASTPRGPSAVEPEKVKRPSTPRRNGR